MPTISAQVREAHAIECREDNSRSDLGLLLVVTPADMQAFERFYAAPQSTALKLKFGADPEHDALRTQVEQLTKQLADAQKEVERYRAAYDKNPEEGAGRFGNLDVD